MARSKAEVAAMEFCEERLSLITGAKVKRMSEGCGYDLEAGNLQVEVKGTESAAPPFVQFTARARRAAQEATGFQMWLVTQATDREKRRLYIIPGDVFLREAKLIVVWELPLGKKRLPCFAVEDSDTELQR